MGSNRTAVKRRIALCLLAATTSLFGCSAFAQTWPARPVRVIVPYPAGGVVDVMTRAVTIRLATDLGQPFVVESKPGAGANIAAEFVANTAADTKSV